MKSLYYIFLFIGLSSMAQKNNSHVLLEKIIYKTIKAYQAHDEKTLNALINKDVGLIFIFKRGAHDNFSNEKNISFKEPTPEYLPYPPLSYNATKRKIKFEKLPDFDCSTETWTKPSGIYCNILLRDTTLSEIVESTHKYLYEIPDNKRKEYKALEQKSHKVIVVDEESEFVFYVTFIKNQWYLTIIDRFESCSA